MKVSESNIVGSSTVRAWIQDCDLTVMPHVVILNDQCVVSPIRLMVSNEVESQQSTGREDAQKSGSLSEPNQSPNAWSRPIISRHVSFPLPSSVHIDIQNSNLQNIPNHIPQNQELTSPSPLSTPIISTHVGSLSVGIPNQVDTPSPSIPILQTSHPDLASSTPLSLPANSHSFSLLPIPITKSSNQIESVDNDHVQRTETDGGSQSEGDTYCQDLNGEMFSWAEEETEYGFTPTCPNSAPAPPQMMVGEEEEQRGRGYGYGSELSFTDLLKNVEEVAAEIGVSKPKSVTDDDESVAQDEDDGLVSDSGDDSSYCPENLEEQEENVQSEEVANFISIKLAEVKKILKVTEINGKTSDPSFIKKERKIGKKSQRRKKRAALLRQIEEKN